MTKLKTLKDIDSKKENWFPTNEGNTAYDLAKNEIKQEAIKWIKEYDRLIQVALENGERNMANQYLGNKEEFMKFFNIAEGDLK